MATGAELSINESATAMQMANTIFGPARAPTKQRLLLLSFDPSTHILACATCRKAKTPSKMCREARLFADQDKVAQREMTGYDTTR